MSISIICKDVDLDIDHSLVVNLAEAEEIVQIDPNVPGSLPLPSCRGRIDTHPRETSDIWGPAPGGQSHWTARTKDLIRATEAQLRDL